jgi:hypothetical protein
MVIGAVMEREDPRYSDPLKCHQSIENKIFEEQKRNINYKFYHLACEDVSTATSLQFAVVYTIYRIVRFIGPISLLKKLTIPCVKNLIK